MRNKKTGQRGVVARVAFLIVYVEYWSEPQTQYALAWDEVEAVK